MMSGAAGPFRFIYEFTTVFERGARDAARYQPKKYLERISYARRGCARSFTVT